jgi:uncharacterized protein YggE
MTMRTLSLIAIPILLCSACSATDFTSEPESVSVTGVGVVAAISDAAVVRLGVESIEDTATDAMRVNSEKTEAIIAALKKIGVREQDMRTEALQLHPRYEHLRDDQGRQTQHLVGYRASNILSARLPDLARAGEAIDATLSAGANRIDNITFEVTDPAAAVSAARDAAWTDARRQAEQLASLAGAKLGNVQRISTSQLAPRPVQEVAMARTLMQSVPLQGGQQEMSVQINVTWSLVE